MAKLKRVTKFETDGTGTPRLRDDEGLCRNARYERVPKRDYVSGRLKGREAVAAWVRNAVIGDLETLDGGIKQRTDMTKGGGNFLLLIGCMMAIDYFATIFAGADRTASQRAVDYAREFMINPRYATCMPLLMHARHGIVHGSWPARVQVGDVQYPFAVGYDYPESCRHLHLSLHQADDETEPKQKLFVNPRLMLADLAESVIRDPGGFGRWIVEKADATAVRRAQPSLIDWRDSDLSEWK